MRCSGAAAACMLQHLRHITDTAVLKGRSFSASNRNVSPSPNTLSSKCKQQPAGLRCLPIPQQQTAQQPWQQQQQQQQQQLINRIKMQASLQEHSPQFLWQWDCQQQQHRPLWQQWPPQQTLLLQQLGPQHLMRDQCNQQLQPLQQPQQHLKLQLLLPEVQQFRAYHPATHRARLLTVKLQQQKQWQDLQLLYDSNGGDARLNAIHLVTVLQQLSRFAPAPELAAAGERQRLKDFSSELVAACHAKLRMFDHKRLALLAQGLVKLGYDMNAASAGMNPAILDGSSSTAVEEATIGRGSSSSNDSNMFHDLLHAVIKQLPQAGSQSCSVLCSALATLLQQQQQQQPQPQLEQGRWQQQQQQQHALLQQLVSCMAARLHILAATGQLPSGEASRVALAACRLEAAVRASLPAALKGAANPLGKELKSLLLLAAEQTVQAAQAAGAVPVQLPLEDTSLLLYSLAKARVCPDWSCVLGLVRQYSLAVADITAGSTESSGHGCRHQQRHAAAHINHMEAEAEYEESAAARSVPPTLWAIGRLLEIQQSHWQRQERKHQHHQQQQQLQCCLGLWHELSSCLPACTLKLGSFSPVQLAQLAEGLSKLVSISQAQLDAAAAAVADQLDSVCSNQAYVLHESSHKQQQQQQSLGQSQLLPTGAKAAEHSIAQALRSQLESPALKRLQQQHVSRVEGLLPLMPAAQRLQLAAAYRQWSVQLPRSLAGVFERDAMAVVS